MADAVRDVDYESLVERLFSVLQITVELNSEKDLDSLLQLIVQEGTRVVEADRGTLWLYDSGADELWARVALGAKREIRIPADSGLAGHVFQSGEVLNIRDVYEDDRFNREIDKATGYRTRSLCAVPMTDQKGRIVGVMQVLNKEGGGAFSEWDEKILSVLCAQAAIAIENARVLSSYEETAQKAKEERDALRDRLSGEFIGESARIAGIRSLAARIANSPVSVMITGESGTGKTHIAKLIHYKSNRYNKPFVYLNCAAIPESLVESELFGIESGTATGVDAKKGRIEMADEGTLFLDEIGDMPREIQAKVLQVIQEKEFVRVGGHRPIKVDIRIISATNKELEKEVNEGRFREDLLYRLNVFTLKMPALRERKEDIPILVDHLLHKACQEYNMMVPEIHPDTMRAMQAYDWPGNVRELENEIRRLVSLATVGEAVGPDLLSDRIVGGRDESEPADQLLPAYLKYQTMPEAMDALQKMMIRETLDRNDGNKTRTAEELDISREGLRKMMIRLDMR